jgi:hypothetical protein
MTILLNENLSQQKMAGEDIPYSVWYAAYEGEYKTKMFVQERAN